MDLRTGNIKSLFLKYLGAAFGSSIITSIYGLVDVAMVGQYHGPAGAAAMSVIGPVWNIIFSLGLLTGIGGSVLFSMEKGQGKSHRENEFFTTALLMTAVLAVLCWAALTFFDDTLFALSGADSTVMPLAQEYVHYLRYAAPFILISQMLIAFLRNDNDPGRATAAVLAGGIFNIFGDYFCVFVLDMGILGAGLATAIGGMITFFVTLSHFFGRKNTLRLVKPGALLSQTKRIFITGFSTFFLDIAMGILTILFNRQIMKYLGTDALAVYGVIVSVGTLVQACSYSIGQAAQPIISFHYGAKSPQRIRETLRCMLYASALFGVVLTALCMALPNVFVRLFMNPTASVAAIAPAIIRTYGLSFLLLPLNVSSTYYFQSIMKPGISFGVSVSRGLVISGLLIMALPAVFSGSAVWLAMPATELVVAVCVLFGIRKTLLPLSGREA